MDRLLAISTLLRVADTGSFSAAARALQVTPAAVSKQIARLEEHLGTRLVHRTTRSQTLTEAGARYVEQCRPLLAELDTAEQALRGEEESPRGTLRVTAPAVFGRLRVMPQVLAFLRAWPEVRVETLFTDARVDLAGAGMDLAIRLAGELPDSAMVGRRIGTIRRVLVASRSYLAARGVPAHPDDLVAHDCLLFRREEGHVSWMFALDGRSHAIRPPHRMSSNDTETLRAAVLADMGIADLPDYMVAEAVAAGTLQPVLEAEFDHQQSVWALQPSRALVPARVTRFVELLERALAPAPALSATPGTTPRRRSRPSRRR
jgi:DNA-binding transcriptional LysR family regulator